MTVNPLTPALATIEAEILQFEKQAAAAEKSNQYGPAVAALTKASHARREAQAIRLTLEGESIRDPVKRLTFDLRRAQAAESWQAVQSLHKQIEDATARAEAERSAKEEAERRRVSPEEKARKLGDMLVEMKPALRRIALERLNLDGVAH